MAYKNSYLCRKKQRGLVLVLVTAAMAALVGIGAFAVDVNHALMNQTRLQNSVDAAALAAAVVVANGGSTASAATIANSTLTQMAGASGNSEMDFSSATINVQFSNDPTTFPDGSFSAANDVFVRVSVSDYDLNAYFLDLFTVDKEIASSAVAGPSAPLSVVCNLVPMAVCSGPDGGVNGYNAGSLYPLKLSQPSDASMGPGNFQLLDFGSGASTIRQALAGNYSGCVTVGETVTTKPGNNVGPVGQGLNTRFDVYSGGGLTADDFPSDIYVKEPDTPAVLENDDSITYTDGWSYSDYIAEAPGCEGDSNCRISSGGKINRRVVQVPIVDCSGASGGTTSLTVEAIGCFFLLQQAPTNNGSKQPVFGEYIEQCYVPNGAFGNSGGQTEGPFRVVLYDDPLSTRS
ncbi:pilus assembly protein TadG-related protein [Vibrio sp. S4M6]|uniref:pilus assembly protein TadG-related protein n=1 Tax=Vibrio sinus TaxID=2946865 RepID=UPI00202A9E7D|nr:pilus assembly protein TadG-related protein [Vibrio sinus]MCL9781444.1 pilus assembly protein TadG-related protein [Vibrio sinus]